MRLRFSPFGHMIEAAKLANISGRRRVFASHMTVFISLCVRLVIAAAQSSPLCYTLRHPSVECNSREEGISFEAEEDTRVEGIFRP